MNSRLVDQIKIRSSNINILRFICAVAVIVSHSYAITCKEDDFVMAFNNGQCNLGGIAVAVFFFLSGLYVTKSLERTDSVVEFMKKRCIRIFPQLWIVVILSVIMGAAITTVSLSEYLTNLQTYKYFLNGVLIPIHDLPGVFGNLPYHTVNGPLWTMPVEFVAYVGLAILAVGSRIVFGDKAVEKRKFLDIIAAVVIFALFVVLYIKAPKSMAFTAIRPMLIFYEGVLYYDYREHIKLNPLLGFVGLIACVVLMMTPFFNVVLVLVFPYSFLALTLGLPQVKADCKLFLISYEMYLVGWPIQQVVMMANDGKMTPLYNWLITLPLDIVIGYLIYKLSERLLMKKK